MLSVGEQINWYGIHWTKGNTLDPVRFPSAEAVGKRVNKVLLKMIKVLLKMIYMAADNASI